MSTQAWALVGVVVGGLLGGGAQAMAEQMRSVSDRKRVQQNRMEAAYTGLLSACHGLLVQGVESNRSLSIEELALALGQIQLTAPNDTFEAARAVAFSAMRGVQEHRKGQMDDETKNALPIQQSRPAFLKLARRDLGIADRPPQE